MNKHANNILTVDNKHNEMIDKFKNNEEIIIPKLKAGLCSVDILTIFCILFVLTS